MAQLVIHVGYPKTATTTFQQHLFPRHPDIDYLGKFIPGFGFRTEMLEREINAMISEDDAGYGGTHKLRELVEQYRQRCARPVLLVSTESIIHPWATDRGLVAQRVHQAFAPCRILITIREQRSSIQSFYGRHGQFGQYLFVVKEEGERLRVPLSFEEWMAYCLQSVEKNYPGVLRYYETIKYYADLFGREHVGVFLYEDFVNDPASYIASVCRFLGVRDIDQAGALLGGKHENSQFAGDEAAFHRLVASLPSWLRGRSMLEFWRAASRRLPAPATSSAESLRDDQVAALSGLYREGNRKLQEMFGLPLDRHGYMI